MSAASKHVVIEPVAGDRPEESAQESGHEAAATPAATTITGTAAAVTTTAASSSVTTARCRHGPDHSDNQPDHDQHQQSHANDAAPIHGTLRRFRHIGNMLGHGVYRRGRRLARHGPAELIMYVRQPDQDPFVIFLLLELGGDLLA